MKLHLYISISPMLLSFPPHRALAAPRRPGPLDPQHSPPLGNANATAVPPRDLQRTNSKLTKEERAERRRRRRKRRERRRRRRREGNGKKEANIFFEGRSAKAVPVDESDVYQTFHGCGASWTDSSAWLVSGPRRGGDDPPPLPDSVRDQIFADLFNPKKGIGLRILRQPMGSSDFRLDDYTYEDEPGQFTIERDLAYIVPTIKRTMAENPDVVVMGLPWSPPAWMKNPRSVNGGTMRRAQEVYDAHGRYFADYVREYGRAGVPIWAVSAQNEPMHASDQNPTMRMTAPEHARLVRSIKGSLVDDGRDDVKVVAYNHNWETPEYPETVLADADAGDAIDAVAFHCYGGDVSAQSRVKRKLRPGQEIWFTECSEWGSGTDWNFDFRWSLRNVVIGATRNWASMVMEWNAVLDQNGGPKKFGGCENCKGLIDIVDWDADPVRYERRPAYYALGHLSKFARVGARRIGSDEPDGITKTVSMVNPDGTALTLILNDWETDENFNVEWFGVSCPVSVPAWSAVTLFSANANDRSKAKVWATHDRDPSTRLRYMGVTRCVAL